MRKIIVCNLYRPPQGNTSEFCNILRDSIQEVTLLFEHEVDLIILGDFKINYLSPTSYGYNDINWFEQRTGLKQLIKEPTR